MAASRYIGLRQEQVMYLGPWFRHKNPYDYFEIYSRPILGSSGFCYYITKRNTNSAYKITYNIANKEVLFTYLHQAQNYVDEKLIERGNVLLTQERFDKLQLLL